MRSHTYSKWCPPAAMSDTSLAGSRQEATVHSVPCRIRVENSFQVAPVDSYFTSSIHEREKGLTASLRGRPLQGIELPIPADYSAVVLKEISDSASHENRQLVEQENVSSIHYWTLGAMPASDHRLPQALAWTGLAQSLHAPLPLPDD